MKMWIENKIKELYPGVDFDVLTPPNNEMGDYSINLAFVLAKKEKQHPKDVAGRLAEEFLENKELSKYFSKIEPADGFVNFYLSEDFLRQELVKILEQKENYGSGENKKLSINLEFVSANPTGPLTVANIRAAAFGDTLAAIFKKYGYEITKEYYINDAGNQVKLLGESVARRYLRLKGKTIDFPDNLYQGEYIIDVAKEMDDKGLVKDIENFDELTSVCREFALKKMIDSAKASLSKLNIDFDTWFSEKKLYDSGEIDNTLKMLKKGEHVYEKEGAEWLKIDDSGERDAVLVKSDKSYSYLMADISYTRNKFIRGFGKAINIWGTDHHGDVHRLKAGVRALGYEDGKLEILLHQLVSLKAGGEKQKMSKRKGEFVLLDELFKEVGKDAVRYFFLVKDLNTHMEFDVDLAKEESKKNPVYYIQYANARLNSIFGKLNLTELRPKNDPSVFEGLKEKEEFGLMRKMSKFPELIEEIALNYQAHRLAQYAFELASEFHNFYEKHRVVNPASPVRSADASARRAGGDDKKIEKARVALCSAIAIVIGECLSLMGISAPKKM